LLFSISAYVIVSTFATLSIKCEELEEHGDDGASWN
jgi:hypothetical protein